MSEEHQTGPRPGRRGGGRPYLVALLAVVVLLLVMAIGPLKSFTAAAERVDDLTASRDRLRAQVAELEEQRERLHDADRIELLAREQLGLVKPGEVPFVVVTPDDRLDPLGPDAGTDGDARRPWYRRLGDAIAGLLH